MFELAQGCIMIASWINCPLLAIELYQVRRYFERFPNDVHAYKAAVIAALLVDLFTVLDVMAASWMYTISHWGESAYQLSQPWPMPGYLFGVGTGAAICQTYLAWRVARFSRNWFLAPVLAVPILGSLIGAFMTAQGAITVTLETRATLVTYVTIWLSFKAGADVLIAALSIYHLRKVKSAFDDTNHLIRRLMLQSVETGSVTAALAIAALILYNLLPNTNTSIAIAMVLGRIYSISMLMALNRRHSDADDLSHSGSRSRTSGARSGFDAISGRHELHSKGGIAVERMTHTNYDEAPNHFDHVQPATVIYRSKADRAPTPQKTADLSAWGRHSSGPGTSEIELAREPLRHT